MSLYQRPITCGALLLALGSLTACQDYALLEEDRLTAEVWSPGQDAAPDTPDAPPSDDLPTEPPDTRTGDGFRPDLPSEDSTADTAPTDTPTDTPSPDDPNPWALSGPSVALGWDHACAISRADPLTPGEVWCWGANAEGQLGTPTASPQGAPQRVPTFTARTRQGAVAVTAGKGFTCALRADGTVWCWGDNREGQLGGGPTTSPLPPTQADTQGTAWAVRAGRAHACALLGGGEVRCWGANAEGQLGDGTRSGGVTPRPVPGLERGAAQVLTDGDISCALVPTSGGQLWCWGADPRWRDRPPTTAPTLWATATTRASLGDDTACVWADDDITPRCVGRHPQAIQGLTDSSSLSDPLPDPVEVSRLDGARSLTLTARTRCFLDRFGWPWCWGHNDQGQLGPDRAGEASSLDPAPIPLPGRASDLAISGLGTLCARLEPGDIWCWGSDAQGALGRGPLPVPFDPSPSPVFGLPPPHNLPHLGVTPSRDRSAPGGALTPRQPPRLAAPPPSLRLARGGRTSARKVWRGAPMAFGAALLRAQICSAPLLPVAASDGEGGGAVAARRRGAGAPPGADRSSFDMRRLRRPKGLPNRWVGRLKRPKGLPNRWVGRLKRPKGLPNRWVSRLKRPKGLLLR